MAPADDRRVFDTFMQSQIDELKASMKEVTRGLVAMQITMAKQAGGWKTAVAIIGIISPFATAFLIKYVI